MTRTPHPARTPATSTLVGILAALAFAAAPASALGEVEIPLDGAISPQYHVPDAAAVVESVTAAVPAAPPVEPAVPVAPPAPAPAPAAPVGEPVDHTESAPQYHAPNKSEYQAQEAPAAAADPEPSQAPPPEPSRSEPAADEPRAKGIELPEISKHVAMPAAPEQQDPPDPQGEPAQPGIAQLPAMPELPDALELPDTIEPSGATELPGTAEPPTMPVAPAVTADNLNLSIRIFSPGDDGPVTQIVQGGSPSRSSPVSAPGTWTWTWNWIGAPGCDPGQPGALAPPLGIAGWTWNWTWSCDTAAGALDADGPAPVMTLPDFGNLPGIELPPLPDLDSLESLAGFDSLPGIGSLPGMDSLPGIDGLSASALLTPRAAGPDEPVADAPAFAAGRERSGGTSRTLPHGGSAAWARAPEPDGIALFASRAAPEPGADRAAKRINSRDITGTRRAIPAQSGPLAPSAAVASAAAAAGAGAAPAMLTTPTFVFLSFLAGALIACVGLPRPKLRASRLERPG
jgi:hypothetical protein